MDLEIFLREGLVFVFIRFSIILGVFYVFVFRIVDVFYLFVRIAI